MHTQNLGDSMDAAIDSLAREAAEMGFDEDEGHDGEEKDPGTGVMTSQLRHFVIQVCQFRHPA